MNKLIFLFIFLSSSSYADFKVFGLELCKMTSKPPQMSQEYYNLIKEYCKKLEKK